MTETRPIAAILAAVGSLGMGASAYLDWLGDRAPEAVPLRRLWDDGVTAEASSYWKSLALPLVIGSVIGLAGAVLHSRTMLGAAFLIGLVTLVWYMIRENDIRDGIDGGDMPGTWVLIGGLAMILVATPVLRHRVAPSRDYGRVVTPPAST